MGILFFLRPQMLRNKLQKKTYRYIRRLLFVVAIFLGILLISAGFKTEGFLSKFLMLLGIIGIIKAVFFIKAKSAEKILNWFLKQPIPFFRFCASVQIAIGVVILLS
ncbi:MAG: hypothetical protein ABIA97_05925 [Candidatus Omnitrophota bacterium]